VRVLVVDDHEIIALAMVTVLGHLHPQAEIVQALDLDEAFARVSQDARFALVMLDLGLPGCTGMQALERFRERFPMLPVVVYSGECDAASINAALELGAMGYIPKTSREHVLIGAIRLVLAGGIYVPVEALKQRDELPVPAVLVAAGSGAPTSVDLGLSPRQFEVLALLLKGLPNKLIARKLDISTNTTKIHISAVYQRLGVATRTQALIAANRLGLRVGLQ
jgi:DNA-binding NarL/FixJ family response regulator